MTSSSHGIRADDSSDVPQVPIDDLRATQMQSDRLDQELRSHECVEYTFPYMPRVTLEYMTPASLTRLEAIWRSRINSRTLSQWQMIALMRGWIHILEAMEHEISINEEAACTLACARLIEEAIRSYVVRREQSSETSYLPDRPRPHAGVLSDSSIVVVTSTFLQQLLARCVRLCDELSRHSNSNDSHVASISDVLTETMESIDHLVQRLPSDSSSSASLPSPSSLLTTGWTTNLLSLFVLTGRHSSVEEMIKEKRIVFSQTIAEPSEDYRAYIQRLAILPGAWNPRDRWRFLEEIFEGYGNTANYTHAIQATQPILLLLLSSCAATTSSSDATTRSASLALGFLNLLEESCTLAAAVANIASGVSTSEGAAYASTDQQRRTSLPSSPLLAKPHSILESELSALVHTDGVQLHSLLHSDLLANPLAHGYTLALQSCALLPDQGLLVWNKLKKALGIAKPAPPVPTDELMTESRRARACRRKAEREAESLLHTPAATSIDLPVGSHLPYLLLQLLVVHGDTQGLFQLCRALGRSAIEGEFFKDLTETILEEQHAHTHMSASTVSPTHRHHLEQLREILEGHVSICPTDSAFDASVTYPTLLCLLLRVHSSLGDLTSVTETWRDLEETDALRPVLESMAMPGGRHVAYTSDNESEPTLDPLLVLHSLDVLGLLALRTGDPGLIDTHFLLAYPSLCESPEALSLMTRVTYQYGGSSGSGVGALPGAAFRHSLLWHSYLRGDWSRGMLLFDSTLHGDSTNESDLFDPSSWTEFGLECCAQTILMQRSNNSSNDTMPDMSTATTFEERVTNFWMGLHMKRLISLSWSSGSGLSSSGSKIHPFSSSSSIPTKSVLRVTLHHFTDQELPASLGLVLRAVTKVVQVHGPRQVNIQCATWQPPEPVEQSEPMDASPLIHLPIPHTRTITLPSLPSLSNWSWPSLSGKSTAPVSVPFASKHLSASSPDASSAVSSIQSYLFEEASAAWMSAPVPTSLSEEDASKRALRRLQKMLLERFRIQTHELEATAEFLPLTREDAAVIAGARLAFVGPGAPPSHMRLQQMRHLMQHAHVVDDREDVQTPTTNRVESDLP